ncbi:MAG TPA: aminoglycoside phosphotransferase family protein [Pseudonocardiaceae bacterium]|nr:aminoglycoside phosphotransferase family protein [Pseudonocardiaceae bacterium]
MPRLIPRRDDGGMQDVTALLVSRFGPTARRWVADAPALAARLAERWELRLGAMFANGASSLIWRCDCPDGTPAVLKLSPDHALVAGQLEMLRLFAPSGLVPAVLAAAPEAGAVVLTEIRPGTEAGDLPPDRLPRQWGALMSALHATPAPHDLTRDLRGRCDESFARIGRRLSEPLIGARISPAMWQRAIERCHRLLDTQSRPVVLHGDLHPGNVLDGGPGRGLMAIDPKACLGDPCFDAVDYVVAGAGQEGIAARCARMAAACGLDGGRLSAWSQVIAPMAAIARLSDDDSGSTVDELLEFAR